MSRSRHSGCPEGRGCIWCGIPARRELSSALEEIEEAEMRDHEVTDLPPGPPCAECGEWECT